MITTQNMKRKPYGSPQKLRILTTDQVKPKTEKEMLASANAIRDSLARKIVTLKTRKHQGSLLTTANMEDRRLNEKRRRLMGKLKAAETPKNKPTTAPTEKKAGGGPKKRKQA